jgi:uncharacterized protein (DUF1684 family)
MSNIEIIQGESMLINFNWNGDNLYTFAEWQSKGMKVKKGEKAIINTRLWKPVTTTDKQTGQTETHYILVKASLFAADQVEEMSDKFKEFLNNKFNKNIAMAL